MIRPTGRKWGDKKPFQVIRKWSEQRFDPVARKIKTVQLVEYEADFWEGPVEAGEEGQYCRRRLTRASTDRLPNCSYAKELEAAFK